MTPTSRPLLQTSPPFLAPRSESHAPPLTEHIGVLLTWYLLYLKHAPFQIQPVATKPVTQTGSIKVVLDSFLILLSQAIFSPPYQLTLLLFKPMLSSAWTKQASWCVKFFRSISSRPVLGWSGLYWLTKVHCALLFPTLGSVASGQCFKSAMLGVFTPWRLANSIIKTFSLQIGSC